MAVFINNGSNYPQGLVVTSTTSNPVYIEGGVTITTSTGVALSVDLAGGLTPIVQNEGALEGGKMSGQTAGAGVSLVGHNSVINSQVIGGYVGNETGAVIAGYYGIRIVGGILAVANDGTITGYYGAGIYANAGGVVANSQGATIVSQGTAAAVHIVGGPATVNSSGLISAASGIGVYLNTGSAAIGGSLATDGTIIGSQGAELVGVNATAINAGTITGATGDGIDLLASGTVTNLGGGTIAAPVSGAGVYLKADGVVSNAATGTITSATGHAVTAAKYISIWNGGVLTAGGTHSVISGAAGGNIYNSAGGSITALHGGGVYLSAATDAEERVLNGGVISGYIGVYLSGGFEVVTNLGRITGLKKVGVNLLNGGYVLNEKDGTITSQGALRGVYIGQAAGTVSNAGLITAATGDGVVLGAGGTITNAAGGTIVSATGLAVTAKLAATVSNGGLISAAGTGIAIALNAGGTVENIAGGTIAAPNQTGVYLNGTGAAVGVVLNAGRIAGMNSGVQDNGTQATVENVGTITAFNTAVDSRPIGLAFGPASSGAYLTNSASGFIGGTVAVQASAAATVLNSGTLYGGSYGLYLSKGGAVTNQASGTIQGSGVITGSKSAQAYGIRISGAPATISNIGTVYGRNAAILVTGGGTVANQVGGLIKNQIGPSVSITTQVVGASDIHLTGSVAVTIANAGTIGAIGTIALLGSINPDLSGAIAATGISAVSGLYLNNLATGTIAGAYGIKIAGGPASITNAGTIHANVTAAATATALTATQAAIEFASGGTAYASNASSGVIYGYAGVRSGIAATVVNAGSITGRLGVELRSGKVINRAGGTITSNGVTLTGASAPASIEFDSYGTVLNAGAIGVASVGAQAIAFNGAASGADYLSNASTGLIFGVVELFRPGTVMNAGTFSGGEVGGVIISSGDTVINAAGGHIDGGVATAGTAAAANTVINAGTINGNAISVIGPATVINQAGGLIRQDSGLPGSGPAVDVKGGAATVTNAGTISGSGYSVYLSPGFTNRLVVDPGAVFVGSVSGGNRPGTAAVSTLEFTAGAGKLAGLGTSISNFGSIVVDPDANWSLAGTISGAGVTNDGTVMATGALVDTATGFENADAVIVSGGSLAVASGGFRNDGTVTVENGGTFFVQNAAALTGGGSILMESGSVTEIAVPVASGQGFIYSDPATLVLDDPAAFDASIGGLAEGDVIALGGETITSGHISGTTLTLDLAGGGTQTLNVAPGQNGLKFSTSSGGLVVACFAAGTRILTASGEVAVEALAAGDLVATLSGRLRRVRWIGFREILLDRHPRPLEVLPVRVQAHAFAPAVPHRDLWLSPDHAVHWANVLIPVRYLCNGTTVRQQAVAAVTYFHVELEMHDILLAEGLPAESFLDTGNRTAFANAGAAFASPQFLSMFQ